MPTTDSPQRATPTPTGAQYLAAQASPEFQELRSTLRRFVFPMTAFFLHLVRQLCAARRFRA